MRYACIDSEGYVCWADTMERIGRTVGVDSQWSPDMPPGQYTIRAMPSLYFGPPKLTKWEQFKNRIYLKWWNLRERIGYRIAGHTDDYDDSSEW